MARRRRQRGEKRLPDPPPSAEEAPPPSRAPRVAVVDLGCPKNTVDSETALAEMAEAGWEVAPDPADADLVLVNTCGFIEEARAESFETLETLLAARDAEGYPRVVALGCMVERLGEVVAERLPGVDGLFGFDAYGRLPKLCYRALGGEPIRSWEEGLAAKTRAEKAAPPPIPEGPRLLTRPAYAYLRLAEGCDNRCAYCAIPAIRGPLRSRSSHRIVEEAGALVDQGRRELVLVAQDTTAYGLDRYGEPRLAPLLASLLEATGDAWIRLLYAHPAHLGEEVIDLLAQEPRLLGYLDLPLQHIDDGVLRAMGRGYGRAEAERLVETLHARVPGLVLRSTLIAGFPGETEAAFEELLDFVRQGHIRHLGVFAYSPEAETAAATLPGRVDLAEGVRRRNALMEAQQAVTFAWLDSRIGTTEAMLLDAVEPDGTGLARSRAEAPEIDGVIRVPDCGIPAGRRFHACVRSRDPYDYDLVAVRAGSD